MLRRISLLPSATIRRPYFRARGSPICGSVFLRNKSELSGMTDDQVVGLVLEGKMQAHQLEGKLQDPGRAVAIRRQLLERKESLDLSNLPYQNYKYENVVGVCCENVVGYIPIPLGLAGPLMIDGKLYHIPMATTEGTLVASTSRGCKAITLGGGTQTAVYNDGMTRAPVLTTPTAMEAVQVKQWMDKDETKKEFKAIFESTSRFAKLLEIQVRLAGNHIFARFKCSTGDAMGMNMASKGVETALELVKKKFPNIRLTSLSGNVCTDKKPAAVNWIEGRGKSVIAEATIPAKVVESVLKTTVADLVEVNIAKNLVGSAVAGSIGGFNAHASNIVTALYLACGQDAAQNVESSNCITLMESVSNGEALHISCTMPSVEVGTVGGGTALPAQSTSLSILGVKGAHPTSPGQNALQLSKIVCSAVVAGELSLMSALAAGHLVKSHILHNRRKQDLGS